MLHILKLINIFLVQVISFNLNQKSDNRYFFWKGITMINDLRSVYNILIICSDFPTAYTYTYISFLKTIYNLHWISFCEIGSYSKYLEAIERNNLSLASGLILTVARSHYLVRMTVVDLILEQAARLCSPCPLSCSLPIQADKILCSHPSSD